MLVTLPRGIVSKGFKLNNGFQPKGFLKGTKVAPLAGMETMGPGVVTIGADPEGFIGSLTVVVPRLLGLGIGWLLWFPIIGVELTTSEEDGGGPELVTNDIDPMGTGCEMDVGAAEDMTGTGATLTNNGPNGSVRGGL